MNMLLLYSESLKTQNKTVCDSNLQEKQVKWHRDENILGLIRMALYVYVLHSFVVGVLLIVFPVELLSIFGYENYSGGFFKVQGGVFHIVMCMFYYEAIRQLTRSLVLVKLSFVVKLLAALFLFLYYFLAESIWMVGLSGLGDLALGLCLWFLTRKRECYGK